MRNYIQSNPIIMEFLKGAFFRKNSIIIDFPKKSFKLAGVSKFGNETTHILIIGYKMNLYCQITSWFVIIDQKVPRKPEKRPKSDIKTCISVKKLHYKGCAPTKFKGTFLGKNSIIIGLHYNGVRLYSPKKFQRINLFSKKIPPC